MCHQDCLRRRGAGPWVDLPGDVLERILNNLSFADLARCSAVCKQWNSIASTTPHFKSLHLPWLLLSPDRSTTSETWALYSPLERRAHRFNVPSASRDSEVLGSCRAGWLLTQNRCKNHKYSLHLSNPFTNRTIRLPRRSFMSFKGVSSSAPPNCNLVLHNFCSLAFCRPGDEEWSPIEIDHSGIRDIAFFKGLLYCATFDHAVFVYEFGPQPVCRNAYTEINRLSIYDACDDEHHEETVYLMESAGELLMVIQHSIEVNLAITSTVHFGVYRLDLDVLQWVEVRSLGDEALILGTSSINAEKFSAFGFKRNCIYFTDDDLAGGNDVWLEFCLENQIIQPFSPRDGSPFLKSTFLFLMLDA